MKYYIVHRREVHFIPVKVTAESPEEAKNIVEECGGEEMDLDNYETYSETLDSETWKVEEVPKW